MSWFWMALLAAVLWGLGYTINQVTLKRFSEIELLFFESLVIFLVLAVYYLFKGGIANFIIKLARPSNFLLILTSSIIYIVASLLIYKSINASNASLAAIIESIYPIFTVLFAFIIFGVWQLNLISALGFVLILCGIVLVKLYGH